MSVDTPFTEDWTHVLEKKRNVIPIQTKNVVVICYKRHKVKVTHLTFSEAHQPNLNGYYFTVQGRSSECLRTFTLRGTLHRRYYSNEAIRHKF